jgi:hypothetical protein
MPKSQTLPKWALLRVSCDSCTTQTGVIFVRCISSQRRRYTECVQRLRESSHISTQPLTQSPNPTVISAGTHHSPPLLALCRQTIAIATSRRHRRCRLSPARLFEGRMVISSHLLT